jgi:hypothetical protein
MADSVELTINEKEYAESQRLYREELAHNKEEEKYWRTWSQNVLDILNDIQNSLRK